MSRLGMDSPVLRALKAIFYVGPLLFGLGFLAPLVAQLTIALDWPLPLGLPPLTFGLLTGLAIGLIAQLRGRWV